MSSARLTRLAAAVLVTAAAGLVGPIGLLGYAAPPAAAAACSSGSGVTVIVDFQQLGGGVQGSCVADGAGQRASTLFPEAGFPLDYVQSQPGFVCRVAGVPSASDEACNDTPPDTAYWGLWWSDGASGTWSYSNYGVGSLKVPDGGYVGFSWKQGGGSAPAPGVAPTAHAAVTPTASTGPSAASSHTAKPKPTASPVPTATPKPSTRPAHPSSATAKPRPSAVPTSSAPAPTPTAAPSDATSSAEASATAGPAPTSAVTAMSAPTSAVPSAAVSASTSGSVVVSDPRPTRAAAPSASGPGLPVWLVVLVVVALFAAAGVLAVLRRRRGGGIDVRGTR